jgi:hypothetical protein
MIDLAQHDLNLKEKCDDDEMEIMEQKIDTIEVLSDDEDEKKETTKENSPVSSVKKPILKHIQYTKDENRNVEQEESATASEQQSPVTLTTDVELIASGDPKLSKRTVVKVEKLEDSKSPVIKEYMMKIQERIDMAHSSSCESSREGTPCDFESIIVVEESGEKEVGETTSTAVGLKNVPSTKPMHPEQAESTIEIADDEVEVIASHAFDATETEDKSLPNDNGVFKIDVVVPDDFMAEEGESKEKYAQENNQANAEKNNETEGKDINEIAEIRSRNSRDVNVSMGENVEESEATSENTKSQDVNEKLDIEILPQVSEQIANEVSKEDEVNTSQFDISSEKFPEIVNEVKQVMMNERSEDEDALDSFIEDLEKQQPVMEID